LYNRLYEHSRLGLGWARQMSPAKRCLTGRTGRLWDHCVNARLYAAVWTEDVVARVIEIYKKGLFFIIFYFKARYHMITKAEKIRSNTKLCLQNSIYLFIYYINAHNVSCSRLCWTNVYTSQPVVQPLINRDLQQNKKKRTSLCNLEYHTLLPVLLLVGLVSIRLPCRLFFTITCSIRK